MAGEWRQVAAQRATEPEKESWRDVANRRDVEQTAKPQPFKSRWYDVPRAALQGLTLGTAGEIGAGIAAGAATVASKLSGRDESFGDIYTDMHKNIGDEAREFSDDSPVTAATAEVLGGLATGTVSGAKVLGNQVLRNMPKWLSAAGLGAVEGGIYGAASAELGERAKGGATSAAIGAVAAPVGGLVIEKTLGTAGNITGAVARKATETPRGTANRVLKDVGESSGLTPDELAARYEALGPEGRVLDIDESLRATGRAIGDKLGPAKRQMRDAVEGRQLGQIDRLSAKIQQTTGTNAAEFADTVAAIAARRAENASPLYNEVWESAQPSELMIELANRPSLKAALRKGAKLAADAGEDVTEASFKQYHFAKMALDDIIGARLRNGNKTSARTLIQLKNELLKEMDEVAPQYKQARDIYAGDSALIESGERGLRFYKMTADEMDDLVAGLSQSEKEMFRRGAVKAIVDKLDDTQLTHDAAKNLVNKKSLQRKLGQLFDSPDDAAEFVKQAIREREFSRTRQVVAGGSPTSQNLAAQQGVDDLAGGALNFGYGDPSVAAGLAFVKNVFGKKPLTPETIEELTSVLIDSGLSREQVRELFTRSVIANQATAAGAALPGASRGGVGAISADRSE